MESNFRSTVLQHPGEDNDRERRHPRDILNPTSSSSVVAPPSGVPPQGPPRHSTFSLRSPTQSEFHPSAGYSSPSGTSINHHHSPPRPALSSFMSPSGQPLPPSGQHTPAGNHHHAAPPSPMRGSPAYYSQTPDLHQTREKPSGRSYYDPTTDTTGERRMAESYRDSTPKVSKPRSVLIFCPSVVSSPARLWNLGQFSQPIIESPRCLPVLIRPTLFAWPELAICFCGQAAFRDGR